MTTESTLMMAALTPQTARMFELIGRIGALHEELCSIYEETYLVGPEMAGEMADAIYGLQDFWLDRATDVMREHFWMNPTQL